MSIFTFLILKKEKKKKLELLRVQEGVHDIDPDDVPMLTSSTVLVFESLLS